MRNYSNVLINREGRTEKIREKNFNSKPKVANGEDRMPKWERERGGIRENTRERESSKSDHERARLTQWTVPAILLQWETRSYDMISGAAKNDRCDDADAREAPSGRPNKWPRHRRDHRRSSPPVSFGPPFRRIFRLRLAGSFGGTRPPTSTASHGLSRVTWQILDLSCAQNTCPVPSPPPSPPPPGPEATNEPETPTPLSTPLSYSTRRPLEPTRTPTARTVV